MSKRSSYYTNIIVKITGPNININNTREAFWSIGQEHVYKSGGVTFEARGFLNQISETKNATHIR